MNLYHQTEEILQNFDWDGIQRLIETKNTKWFFPDEQEFRVPCVEDIKQRFIESMRLLNEEPIIQKVLREGHCTVGFYDLYVTLTQTLAVRIEYSPYRYMTKGFINFKNDQ